MKTRTALLLVVAAEAGVALAATALFGWNLEGLQITTRWSGRLSLAIFSFIFLFWPAKKQSLSALLSENFYLAFALAHGIHLVELLSFVTQSGTELVPYRVAGGFLAYALIFIMPFLQMRVQSGHMSESRFNSLGFIYQFYVWFVFFMTYVARISGSFSNVSDDHTVHRILMGWVCVILGIKLSGLFLKKSKAE
ncbi:MAG TPA: hypothetical protein PLR06_07075 [Cyclobacteriaceae bacterium]|nr:hypothetical protein [Cyclobacteriaceae bacterium]